MGDVDEPLVVLLVELVEEQAVVSPATSARQMATAESWVRHIRPITCLRRFTNPSRSTMLPLDEAIADLPLGPEERLF
jgi:hypothetical protein